MAVYFLQSVQRDPLVVSLRGQKCDQKTTGDSANFGETSQCLCLLQYRPLVVDCRHPMPFAPNLGIRELPFLIILCTNVNPFAVIAFAATCMMHGTSKVNFFRKFALLKTWLELKEVFNKLFVLLRDLTSNISTEHLHSPHRSCFFRQN